LDNTRKIVLSSAD
jgi:hypothetical protein